MGLPYQYYAIRLRTPSGIHTRHVEARNSDLAKNQVKGKGKILSIKKVQPDEVIGTLKSMHFDDIIGLSSRRDTYSPEYTLDSIMFNKKPNRRFNSGKSGEQSE
jgi:hypothetical protein